MTHYRTNTRPSSLLLCSVIALSLLTILLATPASAVVNQHEDGTDSTHLNQHDHHTNYFAQSDYDSLNDDDSSVFEPSWWFDSDSDSDSGDDSPLNDAKDKSKADSDSDSAPAPTSPSDGTPSSSLLTQLEKLQNQYNQVISHMKSGNATSTDLQQMRSVYDGVQSVYQSSPASARQRSKRAYQTLLNHLSQVITELEKTVNNPSTPASPTAKTDSVEMEVSGIAAFEDLKSSVQVSIHTTDATEVDDNHPFEASQRRGGGGRGGRGGGGRGRGGGMRGGRGGGRRGGARGRGGRRGGMGRGGRGRGGGRRGRGRGGRGHGRGGRGRGRGGRGGRGRGGRRGFGRRGGRRGFGRRGFGRRGFGRRGYGRRGGYWGGNWWGGGYGPGYYGGYGDDYYGGYGYYGWPGYWDQGYIGGYQPVDVGYVEPVYPVVEPVEVVQPVVPIVQPVEVVEPEPEPVQPIGVFNPIGVVTPGEYDDGYGVAASTTSEEIYAQDGKESTGHRN